jgi:hypothetical protein
VTSRSSGFARRWACLPPACQRLIDKTRHAGHHTALRLLGRPELDAWEVNTERSYYEEKVLSPDKKHEGTEILVSDKAPPHEAI